MKKCMTNTKIKLLKQLGSLALCLCMIASCLPIAALADPKDDEYIHEHTAECGHDHGEEETIETAYTAEAVKAMIDALPDVAELYAMNDDELNEVYEKAQDAVDAYEALTDEEQIELASEEAKLAELLDFFTNCIRTLTSVTGPYGIEVGLWGSKICTICWEKEQVNSITFLDATLTNGTLYISVEAHLSCGDVEEFRTDGNKGKCITVKNFSCTQNYSGYYDYNTLFHVYRSAGHSTDGWEHDSERHWGYCNLCKQSIDEPHYGGSATCQKKANCVECGVEYGSFADHNYIRNAVSVGNGQHKATCEWCSEEGTADCVYTNGICKYCGDCVQAEKNDEDYYEISNLGQLYWFASKVNSGATSINGKLTADINMENRAWTPIGTESRPYTGIFDGNGKTLSNLSVTATGNGQGLFGAVSKGTVKNFTLRGKIDIAGNVYAVGSVVGHAKDSARIEDVTSYVAITDVRTGATARADKIGGVVGHLDSGSTATKCVNRGNITFANGYAQNVGGVVGGAGDTSANCSITYCDNHGAVTVGGNSAHIGGVLGGAGDLGATVRYCINYGDVTSGGNDCVGGVVAYVKENSWIEYCVNLGQVNCKVSGTSVGGILGYVNNGSFKSLANCFNYGTITVTDNVGGAIVGTCKSSTPISVFRNNYYLNTSCANASNTTTIGDVYAMTAEQFKSGEVAYKLNKGVTDGTQVWYQTCQTDSYPRLSGKTVYMGYVCGSGSSDPVYRNSMDGLITFASPNHKYNALDICLNCGQPNSAIRNDLAQVYEIYNPGHLLWFANYVNAGNTDINGKLMADIDASSLTSLAIGVSGKAYCGTFDGNGHTLTIALDSTAQYAAPFQYVNGATIKNLIVKGSISTDQKFAAGIVGMSTGTTTIEKCLCYVTISSSVNGDGTHGGLVANVSNGTMTINNCGFLGAINGDNTNSCGGLVGWSNGTTRISNSFVAATFGVKGDGGSTFSRGKNITVTNCYYLNALGTAQGTQMTADRFASGEAAWLLNGSDNGTWKQTIGTDSYPNFSGKVVYKITPCEIGYTNNEAEKSKEHHYNDLNCCTDCGGLKTNADGYYEIDTVGKLFCFAQSVNAGQYGINAKLMADLDLSGQTWTPIAYLAMSDSATVGYTGIFDGNGHVISNITVITPTSATANGLFGIITTGTVKNLGIDHLYFDNNDDDHRAGGIAGQLMSGGIIEKCFVVNSTIKASTRVVGGIVGMCKGTVKNCYTANLTLAGHANRFGGITGDYKGGSIINCYTDHAALGSTTGSVGTKDALSQTSVSKNDFASGKITWLLNSSSSEGVWKQTVGTDNYPNFKGATLYKTEPCVSYTNTGSEKQHDYENGICNNCGGTQAAAWDATEQVYKIYNLAHLQWFADKVNGGDTAINGKLMADIDASSSKTLGIGTSENPYSGTFDGNGYTLTIALEGTSPYVAPLRYVNNATVKNLSVKGTILTNDNKFGASLIGDILGGTVTIEKCISYVTITSTVDGDGSHGGLVGVVEEGATLNISYCGFVGAINGNKTEDCGGFVGYSSGTTKIENSYLAATFDISYTHESRYFARGDVNNITITNCYRVDSIYFYWSQGKAKSADEFASGEVAYLLNGSQNDGVWKQTIGTDSYPNFTGGTVYKTTPCASYKNDPENPHVYDDNGVCKSCGETMREEAAWNNSESVYEISNLFQLLWFADKVNGGDTDINGKLTADIDTSSFTFMAIGVEGNAYSGTFDGNGYTITIAFNDTGRYAALFQYVNGATIKNLTVEGSITTAHKFAAGIVGLSTGTTKIENCLSNVTINSSLKSDGTHGGLVANVESGTMTINNCGFVGAINGENTTNCGGLVGWSAGTTKISNSFVAATFALGSGDNYTFSRNASKVSVTNCYYLNALGTAQGTQMNADRFASGEVAWLLNGSKDNGTWKQTLGEDKMPSFSGDSVYKTSPCESYTNNRSEKTKDHNEEYGVCKYCGKLFNIVSAIWNDSKQAYEIYSSAQLVWFSKLVNGTLDGVAQDQSANAILMADIDMSVITDYVPIGGTTGLYYSTEGEDKGYRGIFDGNGHVIKNLSVNGSDTEELTYGVFGTLSGTVKHLGVEDFAFTLGQQDCRAGGIAGQLLSDGLIEDCYVANSTITATGKVAGGIAGCSYAGTIKNCFTYKVTVTAARDGGIVGDNCGDNSGDRKGSVFNCYTDASAIENSSRKGNITGSTAGVSENDFASGQISYYLDYGRDLWKQTIGLQDYPTFHADALAIDGYNMTGTLDGVSVSYTVTWTAMEFTYTYSAGAWDPDTHSYGEGTGTWTVADGGGTITVENLTDGRGLEVKLAYTSYASGVSGTFDVAKATIESGKTATSKLTLSGTPESRDALLGKVDITVSLSWAVGDEVTYVKNGVTYTCYVASKSDSGYVLITKDYVKTCDKDDYSAKINSAINSTGGRLPRFGSDDEKNCLEKIAKSTHLVIVSKGGLWRYWNGSTAAIPNSHKPSNTDKTCYIHIAFDVPIS